MNYTIMELIWLLLIYSFLGWVIETIVGTVKKKKLQKQKPPKNNNDSKQKNL